eukprot:Hpha_TRINITY_DN16182_c1_g6::TRINITY_DN16182_c1_g6_i1::g.8091::m.8091/K09009/K09009; uncharacterized protein
MGEEAAPTVKRRRRGGGEGQFARPTDIDPAKGATAVVEVEGSPVVTLCPLGRAGYKGKDAPVPSATVFWLTSPEINCAVARLEQMGAVSVVQDWVRNSMGVSAAFASSHTQYEARVGELLPPPVAEQFRKHHVGGSRRKFGNGGTSEPDHVKCLHAQVASYLAGVTKNPAGSAVVAALLAQEKGDGGEGGLESVMGLLRQLQAGGEPLPEPEFGADLAKRVRDVCAKLQPHDDTEKGGRKRKRRLH